MYNYFFEKKCLIIFYIYRLCKWNEFMDFSFVLYLFLIEFKKCRKNVEFMFIYGMDFFIYSIEKMSMLCSVNLSERLKMKKKKCWGAQWGAFVYNMFESLKNVLCSKKCFMFEFWRGKKRKVFDICVGYFFI